MDGAMVVCSAPGKLIIFGEHAVVFGEPALSMAINLRTRVRAGTSEGFLVNNEILSAEKFPYVGCALTRHWKGDPLNLVIESDIPYASGMGSSAAVTVATLGALMKLQGNLNPESIAKAAFEVEYEVQGRASPIDTSTSTHGSGILTLNFQSKGFLWEIHKGERHWCIHERLMPKIELVVGDTGIRAATGPLVAKVKEFAERSQGARDAIEEIGNITLKGVEALGNGDLETAGKLMVDNHKLLSYLGVGHPRLDKLVNAAMPYSYGAKLTGAGGGGSIIALTDRPADVSEAIEKAGGKPFIVRNERKGVFIDVQS